MKGRWIENIRGKVIDTSGGVDAEYRNVQTWSKNNGMGQRWWIKYVDQLAPEPRKGQINRQFGLYVQRPFHIMSHLNKHRYLDLLGQNMVIKTPNGRKSQVFWFDQRTKTIKSKQNNGWSFNIAGNGGSSNM